MTMQNLKWLLLTTSGLRASVLSRLKKVAKKAVEADLFSFTFHSESISVIGKPGYSDLTRNFKLACRN